MKDFAPRSLPTFTTLTVLAAACLWICGDLNRAGRFFVIKQHHPPGCFPALACAQAMCMAASSLPRQILMPVASRTQIMNFVALWKKKGVGNVSLFWENFGRRASGLAMLTPARVNGINFLPSCLLPAGDEQMFSRQKIGDGGRVLGLLSQGCRKNNAAVDLYLPPLHSRRAASSTRTGG